VPLLREPFRDVRLPALQPRVDQDVVVYSAAVLDGRSGTRYLEKPASIGLSAVSAALIEGSIGSWRPRALDCAASALAHTLRWCRMGRRVARERTMASRMSTCICAEGASMSACYGGMAQVEGRCVGVRWLGHVRGARALASLGELMTQPLAGTTLRHLHAHSF
jgi:hypothetical protein